MDFGKWKQHDFAALNRIQRSNLRNFLRNNGVYVDKNTSIPKGMIQTLEESRPAMWPEAELLDAIADGTIFNSSLNPYVAGGLAFLKRKEREEKEERRATLSPKPEVTQPLQRTVTPMVTPRVQQSSEQARPAVQSTGWRQSSTALPNRPNPSFFTTTPRQEHWTVPRQVDFAHTPEPHIRDGERVIHEGHSPIHGGHPPTREGHVSFHEDVGPNRWSPTPHGDDYGNAQRGLATLHKIYPKDKKYSGANDILDMKLRIFYDLCPKAGLTPVEYGNAFSTMLTGEASDYYYQKVSGVCATFDAMVYAVRTHFETEERRQRVTTEWEDTNLVQIRDKNSDKSLMKCFELMKNQLIHDQQILRPELQTDTTIRDKIYRAVRMVPECNLATFKPTITFQAACEDIRNAISIRSQTGVPQAFVQDEDSDDDGQHGSFYTDRRFHGQKKRWERPTRGGQRGGKLKPGQRQKICFVCKKVGCWSTNHTEEERRQSIQRFNRDKGFDDKKIHQCITEFEGPDPDTSKDYEQFINELQLIDDENAPTAKPHLECLYHGILRRNRW